MTRPSRIVAMAVIAMVGACGGNVKTEPPRHVTPNGHGGVVATRTGTGGLLSSSAGGASAGGAGGVANSCAPISYAPKSAPVDLYLMIDQSEAVAAQVQGSDPPVSYWEALAQGVADFVHDPGMVVAGTGVGVQFYPMGPAPQSCDADYATPAVEIGLLPGNAEPIVAAFAMRRPAFPPVTAPALSGAIAHIGAWSTDHRGRRVVGVFVAGSSPRLCFSSDAGFFAANAKEARYWETRVQTLVVGLNLGREGQGLEILSESAGTSPPILIDGGDVRTEVSAALDGIWNKVARCGLAIPLSPDGTQLDATKIALTYTSGYTGKEIQIPKLNTRDDCTLNRDQGWYLDDPAAPGAIEVCATTCATVSFETLKVLSYPCDIPREQTR
jgi:hypothetical protein